MYIETAFRPSLHGFPFPNLWDANTFGPIASRGMCGGMVFAALDAFEAGRTSALELPPTLPSRDSETHRRIRRYQRESVVTHAGWNLRRFAVLTYLPTPSPAGAGITTRQDLPPLFDALAAGKPVPLGLISALGLRHLVQNHQVLAWAGDFGEREVVVRVYDPNYPLRDDVVLEVGFDSGPVIEHAGSRRTAWRGFFIERR
ncbi:MAG: hypothetical protein LLG24_00665 [Actinomycetia bacterium]|nr:hypothetical protein [Actinomycetes bacterium]